MADQTSKWKRWYEKQRALDLCVSCGSEPTDGKTRCNKCITHRRANLPKHSLAFYICNECGNPGKHYKCPEHATLKRKRYNKSQRDNLWERVFALYGDVCSCCGEENKLFLTVDHINRDGSAGGRQGRESRWHYIKEKRNDIRILCYNCNCGRERNGGICPHQT